MKKFLFFSVLALPGHLLFAQTIVVPVDSSDAERARINTERARQEVGFSLGKAACLQKFFVNSCLDEINISYREAIGDLRRQEIALDDRERKLRGVEQISKTEEKASLEKQQDAAKGKAAADAMKDETKPADGKGEPKKDEAPKAAPPPAKPAAAAAPEPKKEAPKKEEPKKPAAPADEPSDGL